MSTAAFYTPARLSASRRPTLSFELFPPRPGPYRDKTWGNVARLIAAAPDFISVTYGAAGAQAESRDQSVRVLMRVLSQRPNMPAVAHLTCANASRGQLAMTIRLLLHAGIRDFLALRGDPPADGGSGESAFAHADGLVALIREIAADVLPRGVGSDPGGTGIETAEEPGDYVSIAVAAYPATAGEWREREIAALAAKRNAGADYALTQVFYEADQYGSLVDDLAHAGVDLPIVPGVIPFTSQAKLRRLESISGVTVPQAVLDRLSDPDPGRRAAAGIRATVRFICELRARQAPGIHLYTFNHCRPTLDIVDHLRAQGYFASGTGADGRMPSPASKPSRVDAELVRLALHKLPPTF